MLAVEARDDYDDDSDVVGLDELRQLGLQLDAGAGDANDFVTREMLQSNVVDSEWKLEVERILPQLKTAVETESKVMCQPCDLQRIFVRR